MKQIFDKSLLLIAAATTAAAMPLTAMAQTSDTQPRFRHVVHQNVMKDKTDEHLAFLREAVLSGRIPDDTLRIRSVEEILEDTRVPEDMPTFNRLNAPWVFAEYRALDKKRGISLPALDSQMPRIWRLADEIRSRQLTRQERQEADSIAERRRYLDNLWGIETSSAEEDEAAEIAEVADLQQDAMSVLSNPRPAWLENAFEAWNLQDDFMYTMMVEDPSLIEYAYWQLPVPPTLPEDDHGFKGFLKRSFVSGVNVDDAVISDQDIQKKHWLHVVNGALQFSQAYVSGNWYQGGNNHLALLINFLWDVQLNTVWHPNLLLQSTLSYKLGLNSVEDDEFRKYSISQDIFQYNFKFGYKARRNWYYTVTAQFKTQLLNNYKKNTETRIASILTPGDLNLGLGMTYSKTNAKKTIQFNASIAPVSYNLKTAVDAHVDHNLFGIPQTAKSQSEIGSNADITLNWKIGKMVTYKTRLFLFTDYDYFLGDWENTLNIQFSRFFSTQIYANLRYDSSADSSIAPNWKKFMLKEILSIGLSYTFSTKQ